MRAKLTYTAGKLTSIHIPAAPALGVGHTTVAKTLTRENGQAIIRLSSPSGESVVTPMRPSGDLSMAGILFLADLEERMGNATEMVNAILGDFTPVGHLERPRATRTDNAWEKLEKMRSEADWLMDSLRHYGTHA